MRPQMKRQRADKGGEHRKWTDAEIDDMVLAYATLGSQPAEIAKKYFSYRTPASVSAKFYELKDGV